jgi:hypothetical protein
MHLPRRGGTPCPPEPLRDAKRLVGRGLPTLLDKDRDHP